MSSVGGTYWLFLFRTPPYFGNRIGRYVQNFSAPIPVKEGEMIIMPANKPHALKAVTRYKMLLVMIK